MKKTFITFACFLLVLSMFACSDKNEPEKPVLIDLSEQNIIRAMEITDKAVACYFEGTQMKMARYYNPYTDRRESETGSIWMYSSAIEAVNAILKALETHKEKGNAALYDQHFARYADLLWQLYDNADYYLGTFTLTSYTQTRQWTVYGVNRGSAKGTAQVQGIENVYDDQMWLVRELFEAFQLTGKSEYLQKAEYLTEYVLDGWDCHRNSSGQEYGGITWGPGYATKHACSNAPMISPLVWLHEYYKGKSDEITHYYIDASDRRTRKTEQLKKSEHYLNFAKKIYAWQKTKLLTSNGVYNDLIGGDNNYADRKETIDGVLYKIHAPEGGQAGPEISYNSGTMLSGAADLYRATGDNAYLQDAKTLTDKSFVFFAKLGATMPDYYTYSISGFNNWFNGVLMRGYVDVYPAYNAAETAIGSFQQNLDYAYRNFLHNSLLPTSLLVGWSRDNAKNKVEGMFEFAFAAEYAVLAHYELEK